MLIWLEAASVFLGSLYHGIQLDCGLFVSIPKECTKKQARNYMAEEAFSWPKHHSPFSKASRSLESFVVKVCLQDWCREYVISVFW